MRLFLSGQRDLCFIIDITISLWDYLRRERIYLFQEDSGQMHDRCEIDRHSEPESSSKAIKDWKYSLNRLC